MKYTLPFLLCILIYRLPSTRSFYFQKDKKKTVQEAVALMRQNISLGACAWLCKLGFNLPPGLLLVEWLHVSVPSCGVVMSVSSCGVHGCMCQCFLVEWLCQCLLVEWLHVSVPSCGVVVSVPSCGVVACVSAFLWSGCAWPSLSLVVEWLGLFLVVE